MGLVGGVEAIGEEPWESKGRVDWSGLPKGEMGSRKGFAGE